MATAPEVMKWIFLAALVVLGVATFALYATRQAAVTSDAPVLYLAIPPGPDSLDTLKAYQGWLKETGLPAVDLRVDPANSDATKVIIQGISGIGSDLIPTSFGADMQYLHATGLLTDLTPNSAQEGFGPETILPAARDETMIDGRQYGYPTLLYVLMNYINVDTFAQVGMATPPARMNFDQFEAIGKEFVAKANPPGQKARRFFCNGLAPLPMRRSLGLDTFNETLTRCTLDDPRNAQVLELIDKWTNHDHLFPSAADMASFTTDGSTAAAFGPRIYQFRIGNIAIIGGSSYLAQTFRQWPDLKLAVTEPPYGEFSNAVFGASMLSIYAGSKHPDSARTYLRFLASSDYLQWLSKAAVGIPANAEAAHSAAYLRPPDHPAEWPCNERFVDAIEQIGIPYTSCPYVLYSVYSTLDDDAVQRYNAGLCSAPEAGRRAADAINEEIQRTLTQQPELRARYDTMVERQHAIDALRARGEKVPLAWIENPFYRRYYQFKQWAE